MESYKEYLFHSTMDLPQPLSDEETMKYLLLVKEGNILARNKLIEHNLRLITFVIDKYFSNSIHDNMIDFDDLFQVGSIGLAKAVISFKIEKGIKFSTYASTAITKEIFYSLKKGKSSKNNLSLNTVIYENKHGDELTMENALVDNQNIEEELIEKEHNIFIRNALNILNDFERDVIELYFGFNGEPLSQPQIADIYGYSKANISRKKVDALNKIKKHLEKQGIYKKEEKSELDYIKNLDSEDKALFFAKAILDDNITLDELTKKTGLNKSSIRATIAHNLPLLDNELYLKVKDVIEKQKVLQKQLKVKKV